MRGSDRSGSPDGSAQNRVEGTHRKSRPIAQSAGKKFGSKIRWLTGGGAAVFLPALQSPETDHRKYSLTTYRSDGDGDLPFKLASITRRQISTVA